MKKTRLFWLLIFSLLVIRIFYFFAQPDLSSDHLLQMAMAQNFMGGEGFSLKYLNSVNEIYYTTNIQSPPVYPFFLALVTFITSNTLFSSFIIQVAALILLIFIWKKIFNLFKNFILEEAYFYFIALLIISASIINNINTILVFTLLLLSASIYFTFAYLLSNDSKKSILFLASFFASLLFWTHYSYFLVAFFPAITLFIIYYLKKEKGSLLSGIYSFVISLFITSGVLIYNYINTGYINYMDNPHIWEAGFFPEHLLLTDPFFLNAFFKTSYFFDYLFANNSVTLFTIVFHSGSLIILFFIIILFLKLRTHDQRTFNENLWLFIPFIVISALTISFLLYFTLHYHEIPRPGWTHIGDPRYLSSVYLSVLVIIILLLFVKTEYLNKIFWRFIRIALLTLIIVSALINIYIAYKEWGIYSYEKNAYNMPTQELQSLFTNIKFEQSKGNVPVFIDNELTVRSFRISQFAGAAVISSREVLNIEKFPSHMIFFFIMPSKEQLNAEDQKILKWGEKFNLENIGIVYTNTKLYKVNKL